MKKQFLKCFVAAAFIIVVSGMWHPVSAQAGCAVVSLEHWHGHGHGGHGTHHGPYGR